MVLEKTLESPLDCKEIQPVHSKGDWSWVFFGRTDAKAETPILWPPHAKRWLIGKDSDAGRDWGQEEKGTTEDEMAWWHHRLDAHEFGWTPGVGDGQGGLACRDSWGRKESDMTEWLNWTELMLKFQHFDHLMQRANSLEKNLILQKIEGKRRREWQRRRWLDDIIDSMDMILSKHWEIVKDREVWHAAGHGSQRVGHYWRSEQQQHMCRHFENLSSY